MEKVKTLCTNILICILALIFTFTILEVSARVYINSYAGEQSFKKYASLDQIHQKKNKLKYTPHPYLRYYPTPNYRTEKNKHNSLGYRGDEIDLPKPEGRYRIVCIGGSTTYTNEIDDYKMSYPYLLEKNLKDKGFENIDVINAGVSGWTSWESLINFELRIMDLEPDMIIIYHGINDIHARLVWPPQAYKGDNTGEIGTAGNLSMPSIIEYSSLLRILMINAGVAEPHASLARLGRHGDESEKTYFMMDFKRQKYINTYPKGIFVKTSAMKMLRINTPKYFRRNINNIVRIANDENIKTVIASFAYSPLFENYPLVSSEEYISAYKEMNSVLKDIADKTDVYFFDFEAVFPDDKRYYRDGRHVNEEGVNLKAEMFTNYIVDNKLVPQQ